MKFALLLASAVRDGNGIEVYNKLLNLPVMIDKKSESGKGYKEHKCYDG